MEEEKKRPGRGGARPGSGRKKQSEKKISFRCPKDVLDALDGCGNMSSIIVYALRKFFGLQPPSSTKTEDEDA